MQADYSLISRLEKLARLRLAESEKEVFSKDLSQILNMVDKLLELDTAEIEPLAYPTTTANNLRGDEANSPSNQADALKNAPDHNDQFFQVPKVIE